MRLTLLFLLLALASCGDSYTNCLTIDGRETCCSTDCDGWEGDCDTVCD